MINLEEMEENQLTLSHLVCRFDDKFETLLSDRWESDYQI